MNLDTYDDVAKDYRFYEDPGDEFRNPPDGVSQTKKQKLFSWYFPASQTECLFLNLLSQVLLPLWNFVVEDVAGLEVTQLQWSSKYLGKTLF